MQPPSSYFDRLLYQQIESSLLSWRVTAVCGARQTGKTFLARKIAEHKGMQFFTLDDLATLDYASADPKSFIENLDSAVIDEIQRVPKLILALKQSVDQDPRPGRFLITGSVEIFRRPDSLDSLAGRVNTWKLYPLAMTEMASTKSSWLENVFSNHFNVPRQVENLLPYDLLEHMVRGGYPEAYAQSSPAIRSRWFRQHFESLAERDVWQISQIHKIGQFVQLMSYLAEQSAEMLDMSKLSRRLGVSHTTVDQWLYLYERMFLVHRLPAWSHHALPRLVKRPKLFLYDTGLQCALRDLYREDFENHPNLLGPFIETFVFAELIKIISSAQRSVKISYYRNKEGVEVDFLLEYRNKIVAIEVKSTKSPSYEDLKRFAAP